MTIVDQRKLSIIILEDTNNQLSLYDFDEFVKADKDVIDICAYFENYQSKYNYVFVETDDKNGIIKKMNPHISALTKAIRGLNNEQFEKVSAIICQCLGFGDFHAATPSKKDEGIDFIAFRDNSLLKIDNKEYVVGQSKHFIELEIGTKEIRELSGSVLLFSRKEFSTSRDKYSEFKLGAFSPVHVLFIANYFFSREAIKLCKATSIIPLDIIDIIGICIQGINEGIVNWLDTNGKIDITRIEKDIDDVIITS